MKIVHLGVLVVGVALAAGPAYPESLPHLFQPAALYHRFTSAPSDTWQSISIDLAPHAWRAGSVDGPVATETELRSVLGNLTELMIGGKCVSAADGDTSYPCAFAVGDPDLAGIVSEQFIGIPAGWRATSGTTIALAKDYWNSGSILAIDENSGRTLTANRERYVGLLAPTRYLGNKGQAFGGQFSFKFRAVSNGLVPSTFDQESGTVVMLSDPTAPVPGPPPGERTEERPRHETEIHFADERRIK